MKSTESVQEKGLSLKVTSIIMFAFSLVISGVLIFATARAFINFRNLEKSTELYIDLQNRATELLEASDYLTEQVQCYTVLGQRRYLDRYFVEAFETRRREAAISAIEEVQPNSLALYELRESMDKSVQLMNREYYAMRLVLEARGDIDIPEALTDVTLTAADAALSPEEKIELAVNMVHDNEYYFQKTEIRRNLDECLQALRDKSFDTQQGMDHVARRALISVMILIIIQTASIFGMLKLHTELGIKPLIRAAEHISRNESVPVIGASEFRYLAGAYNVMYNTYKNSIANLNFKASHDELTGAYNRAGYDIIKNNIDLTTTALIVVDADEFKSINDNYGHKVGDDILKKIANTLKRYHRSDDYVCRIGGDEFVVLMVHLPDDPRGLIEDKITMINNDLRSGSDGLPPVSLSVGVAFDPECRSPEDLFKHADTALYHVKQNGRCGCCFYSSRLKGASGRA